MTTAGPSVRPVHTDAANLSQQLLDKAGMEVKD